MVDEDCISWIDIVHTAYYTVLKDIPDGRSVRFSVRAEMPNGGYYEVKSDADVLALVKIFKEQGRAMLLKVYGVNVGDATLDREAEEQDKKILLKMKLLVKEEDPLHREAEEQDKKILLKKKLLVKEEAPLHRVPALVVFSNSSKMMMEGM
ncbi:hypothetical protein NE237_022731 [Protea cynaroides]|uniref:Uncharacterized protein n=1 Tax=Protea cynaroides TaxID=273540 RepID=A0A9Q0K4R5_9MAGN|nr:hypothetical protein NE237_022731 [Protea cynaroides]